MRRDQAAEGLRPQGGRRGPRIEDLQPGIMAACRLQHAAKTLGALQRTRVQLSANEGDAPPPPRQQMARHGPRRPGLGKPDAVHRRIIAELHHMDARRAAGLDQAALGLAAIKTGQNQARRPVRQIAVQQGGLALRPILGDPDKDRIAGVPHHLLDGLQQLGEQRIGQQRNQHHHMAALGRRQRARRRIGAVAEPRHRSPHPLGQIRPHGRLARHHPRRSDGADAGQGGHVGQRHPTRGPAAATGDGGPDTCPIGGGRVVHTGIP